MDCLLFFSVPLYLDLHAKVRLPNAVIRSQGLVRSMEHDATSFQHVAAVSRFKRLGNSLFDEKDG